MGLIVTRALFDFFGTQMGLGTGLFRMPSVTLVALTVPLMLALSVVGVALPAWRASQIRVTEALWRG